MSNELIVQVQADATGHVLTHVLADVQAHADAHVRALLHAPGGALPHVDAQARVLDDVPDAARDVVRDVALQHDAPSAIHARAHAPVHAHGDALGRAPDGDPNDALAHAPHDVQARVRTHAHAAARAPHDAVHDDAPRDALSGVRALVASDESLSDGQACGQGGQVHRCLSHGSC